MLGPGGGTNGFVTVLNLTGTGLIALGVFGGQRGELRETALLWTMPTTYTLVDSLAGRIFPTTTDAFCPGCFDGFVMNVLAGPVLAYSTLVPAGIGKLLVYATGNNVYVAGGTNVPGLQVMEVPCWMQRCVRGQTVHDSERAGLWWFNPPTWAEAGYYVAFGIAFNTSNSGGVSAYNCDAYVTGVYHFERLPSHRRCRADRLAVSVRVCGTYCSLGGDARLFDILGRKWLQPGIGNRGRFGESSSYNLGLPVSRNSPLSTLSGIGFDSNPTESSWLELPTDRASCRACSPVPRPARSALTLRRPTRPELYQSTLLGTNRTGVWRSIDGGMNYSQLATIGSWHRRAGVFPAGPSIFLCA